MSRVLWHRKTDRQTNFPSYPLTWS